MIFRRSPCNVERVRTRRAVVVPVSRDVIFGPGYRCPARPFSKVDKMGLEVKQWTGIKVF